VTRDATTDVTAENTTANEHHHVVEKPPFPPAAEKGEEQPNGSLPSSSAAEPDRPPEDRDEPTPTALRPLPPTLIIDEYES